MRYEPRGVDCRQREQHRREPTADTHVHFLPCVELPIPRSLFAFLIPRLTQPSAFLVDLEDKSSCSFLPLSQNVP